MVEDHDQVLQEWERSIGLRAEQPQEVGLPKTTLMMRNLPGSHSQASILALLRSQKFIPGRDIDFFYLPIDFRERSNYGYCFINFTTPSIAQKFQIHFTGFTIPAVEPEQIDAMVASLTNGATLRESLAGINIGGGTTIGGGVGRQVCEIGFARVQGKTANIEQFRNSPINSVPIKKYRPLIFNPDGTEADYPAPEHPVPPLQLREPRAHKNRRRKANYTGSGNYSNGAASGVNGAYSFGAGNSGQFGNGNGASGFGSGATNGVGGYSGANAGYSGAGNGNGNAFGNANGSLYTRPNSGYYNGIGTGYSGTGNSTEIVGPYGQSYVGSGNSIANCTDTPLSQGLGSNIVSSLNSGHGATTLNGFGIGVNSTAGFERNTDGIGGNSSIVANSSFGYSGNASMTDNFGNGFDYSNTFAASNTGMSGNNAGLSSSLVSGLGTNGSFGNGNNNSFANGDNSLSNITGSFTGSLNVSSVGPALSAASGGPGPVPPDTLGNDNTNIKTITPVFNKNDTAAAPVNNGSGLLNPNTSKATLSSNVLSGNGIGTMAYGINNAGIWGWNGTSAGYNGTYNTMSMNPTAINGSNAMNMSPNGAGGMNGSTIYYPTYNYANGKGSIMNTSAPSFTNEIITPCSNKGTNPYSANTDNRAVTNVVNSVLNQLSPNLGGTNISGKNLNDANVVESMNGTPYGKNNPNGNTPCSNCSHMATFGTPYGNTTMTKLPLMGNSSADNSSANVGTMQYGKNSVLMQYGTKKHNNVNNNGSVQCGIGGMAYGTADKKHSGNMMTNYCSGNNKGANMLSYPPASHVNAVFSTLNPYAGSFSSTHFKSYPSAQPQLIKSLAPAANDKLAENSQVTDSMHECDAEKATSREEGGSDVNKKFNEEAKQKSSGNASQSLPTLLTSDGITNVPPLDANKPSSSVPCYDPPPCPPPIYSPPTLLTDLDIAPNPSMRCSRNSPRASPTRTYDNQLGRTFGNNGNNFGRTFSNNGNGFGNNGNNSVRTFSNNGNGFGNNGNGLGNSGNGNGADANLGGDDIANLGGASNANLAIASSQETNAQDTLAASDRSDSTTIYSSGNSQNPSPFVDQACPGTSSESTPDLPSGYAWVSNSKPYTVVDASDAVMDAHYSAAVKKGRDDMIKNFGCNLHNGNNIHSCSTMPSMNSMPGMNSLPSANSMGQMTSIRESHSASGVNSAGPINSMSGTNWEWEMLGADGMPRFPTLGGMKGGPESWQMNGQTKSRRNAVEAVQKQDMVQNQMEELLAANSIRRGNGMKGCPSTVGNTTSGNGMKGFSTGVKAIPSIPPIMPDQLIPDTNTKTPAVKKVETRFETPSEAPSEPPKLTYHCRSSSGLIACSSNPSMEVVTSGVSTIEAVPSTISGDITVNAMTGIPGTVNSMKGTPDDVYIDPIEEIFGPGAHKIHYDEEEKGDIVAQEPPPEKGEKIAGQKKLERHLPTEGQRQVEDKQQEKSETTQNEIYSITDNKDKSDGPEQSPQLGDSVSHQLGDNSVGIKTLSNSHRRAKKVQQAMSEICHEKMEIDEALEKERQDFLNLPLPDTRVDGVNVRVDDVSQGVTETAPLPPPIPEIAPIPGMGVTQLGGSTSSSTKPRGAPNVGQVWW